MSAYVVVATKNRAKETYVLLDYLAKQTLLPAHTVIVGSEAADINGLDSHPSVLAGHVSVTISAVGSTVQRNAGLDALLPQFEREADATSWFVTFFDDDFRPADNWLENANREFQDNPQTAGITGYLLADGVKQEFGISEEQALQYLSGALPKAEHWSNSGESQILDDLYGCNMSYRGTVAMQTRFDENLPMYAWQEDVDYSSRARVFGDMKLLPTCKGVHMGSSSGRTSGVRFGYSQIANPIFLARKGTMTWRRAGNLMSRNIASNLGKTLLMNRSKDFPGRVRGNLHAFAHLLSGKLDPLHILRM